MTGYILFVAVFVWIVSYVRLPKWSYPQVNIVQRCSQIIILECMKKDVRERI